MSLGTRLAGACSARDREILWAIYIGTRYRSLALGHAWVGPARPAGVQQGALASTARAGVRHVIFARVCSICIWARPAGRPKRRNGK